MLRNKRGQVVEALIVAGIPTMVGMLAVMLTVGGTAAYLTKDSFRVKKAKEMGCYVEGMSKAEVMDCIRDDEVTVGSNFAK